MSTSVYTFHLIQPVTRGVPLVSRDYLAMSEATSSNLPANLHQPPPTPRPSARVIDRTYHPKGYVRVAYSQLSPYHLDRTIYVQPKAIELLPD